MALKIKPDKHAAAINWGNALGAQAKTEAASGALDAARGLWSQVAEKYALALKIKPDKHEAVYNWGIALGAQACAEAAAGALDTARGLWSQSAEKFALALKIKPDTHEAAANWGTALLVQASAEAKEGDVAAANGLLNKAQSLFTDQVSQYPNAAPTLAYNWACLHGLQGHAAACVAQLEIARAGNTLPNKEHLQKDKDLDLVRHSPEFTDWWKRHFGDDPT